MSDKPNLVNVNSWLWRFPEYIDKYRIFPRAFCIFYFLMCWQIFSWFVGLPDPNMAQAGFAGAVISMGSAFFGIYVGSRKTANHSQSFSTHAIYTEPPSAKDDKPKG